jgi:UDP-GlcNAc:undecaprenyl-phosphate GlcNAc-1-phosphate transferase
VLIMYFWAALVAFVTVLVAASPQRRPIVFMAIGMTLVGLLMLLGPRLGDHRDRLRNAARNATPDRWRGEPATPARHRAGGVPQDAEPVVSIPAIKQSDMPLPPLAAGPTSATATTAETELPATPGTAPEVSAADGGMRQRHRTLSG